MSKSLIKSSPLCDRLSAYLSSTVTAINYRDISEDVRVSLPLLNAYFNNNRDGRKFAKSGLIGVDYDQPGSLPIWATRYDVPHVVRLQPVTGCARRITTPDSKIARQSRDRFVYHMVEVGKSARVSQYGHIAAATRAVDDIIKAANQRERVVNRTVSRTTKAQIEQKLAVNLTKTAKNVVRALLPVKAA